MIYIIGCGGGGSWLAPSMCLLRGQGAVCLIDGDTLEPRNLNRQLFDETAIGLNKAKALADKYGCSHNPGWYNFGVVPHTQDDWLMVCVDNNPARLAVLEACDHFGCRAIFAANEKTSAEAYLYMPSFKGLLQDPRVMYPTMLTNRDGDPQAAAVGCTGVAQVKTPQLVSANFMSAALAQHLFVLWAMELNTVTVTRALLDRLPHKLVANLSSLETHTIGK